MEKAYMQRVIEERDDLVGKIERLTKFIASNPDYKGLTDEGQFLLVAQCNVMQAYAHILDRRIEVA